MAGGLQFQDNPGRGFFIVVTIAQYVLCKQSALNTVIAAVKDANNDWLGVTMEPRTYASTALVVPVRFRSAGTLPVTASATEAIAVGDVLYKANAGRVGKTSTGSIAVGIAMSTAAIAGDFLEMMPY